MAEWLLKQGVDAVIGSHPHVVQPIEYVTVERENGVSYTGVVAYSLGNFLSGQAAAPNLIAGVAELTVTKDGDEITVGGARFYPTITQYGSSFSNVHLVAWPDYTSAMASSHGVRSHDSRFSYTYIENLLRNTIPEDILVMD